MSNRKPKTQTTSLGYELPVPMHKDVLRDLRKVSAPVEGQPKTRSGKKD